MSSDLVAIALPLVGVALGSAGTFAGTYLTTRETKKQAKAAKDAAAYAELKEATLGFLEACQRVEQAAEHRYMHEDRYVKESPELTHEMWYREKCLEIVTGPRVRHTALEFATRLNDATYKGVPHGTKAWDYVSQKRDPFMAAVRAALKDPIEQLNAET